ncbi:MAG TPA: glycosyltransferase, partial [Rubrivivax sp.]|nr:glycosyltransferase [Rubrivivax sp.]
MSRLQRLRAWWARFWPSRRLPEPPPASAPVPALPAPPKACATVVIPALNEAARIGEVVRYAWADAATAQVIVVDDSSIDDTAALARAAGAEVITSTMLGKGASMRDGALAARLDLVVYLDGDLGGLRHGIVTDLCQPLTHGDADFVKARFGRMGLNRSRGRRSGHVVVVRC